jgi:glycosyltransferase involved in cell wall biosynthesis
MKVSVLITTYNQEGFIAQALGSVLMQQVNFPFEIVLGEDASTDLTREIVSEFAKKYSDKLRILYRDEAEAKRDRAAGVGGKGSFVNCLAACKGEYVALLDGDDYWTSPHKLQRQVDFLDQHPDFAICFHGARIVDDEGTTLAAGAPAADQPEILSFVDLLVVNSIPACSAIFRRGLFGELPSWFYGVTLGDWALHLMNAQHGKIGRLSDVMAAYRIHPEGFWPSLGPERQRIEIIKVLDHISREVDSKFARQIRTVKAGWYYQLAGIALQERQRFKAMAFLGHYILLAGFEGVKQLRYFPFKRPAQTLKQPIPTSNNVLG